MTELTYHDAKTGLSLVLADAAGSPELWQAFLVGARQRYALHGYGHMVAVCERAVARGIERFSALVREDRVVAGLRVRGPLNEDDLPICRELDGYPASAIIHGKIRARLGEGLLEGKTAWVEKGVAGRGPDLFRLLVAGAYLHLPAVGCRWIVGTVSPFSVPMFTANGGQLDEDIEPVPFAAPDSLTGVIWHDRARLAAQIAAFARLAKHE